MKTGYFDSSPVLAWQFLWAWPLKGGQGVELPLLTPQQWSPQLAANWMLNMIGKVLAITHENIINWFEKCKTYLELLAPRMCGLLPSTRSARKLIKEFSSLISGLEYWLKKINLQVSWDYGEINFPPFPVWKLPVNIGSLVAILGDRKPGEPEGKNLAIARMKRFDQRDVQGKVFVD